MNGSRRRRQTDTSRILVGYWRESTEPEPNQHAVYGILSRDGKLRFKVVAETRDGAHISGPLNPGDSWIVYDEVGLEPHLEGLNRLEMKEYCRVREHQQGQGEQKEDAASNRLKAVDLAKEIAEAAYGHERPRNLRWAREKCADERRAQRKLKKKNAGMAAAAAAAAQLDQIRMAPVQTPSSAIFHPHNQPPSQSQSQSQPAPPVQKQQPSPQHPPQQPLPRPPSSENDTKDRVLPPVAVNKPRTQSGDTTTATKRHSLPGAARPAKNASQRTPLRPEPVLDRSQRASAAHPGSNSAVKSSQKPSGAEHDAAANWHCAMQPVVGTMGPKGEAKSHDGITYKWKEAGLFSRMYVSPGSIITIDKEDYVEYRILTTPTN